MRKLALVLMVALLACGFTCSPTNKRLAVASDAIAHSLANAQTAVRQGVTSGVVSQADADQFEVQLVKLSEAGLILDEAIRNNESSTSVSDKVNAFLGAFNALNNQGLAGIKDPNLKLALSTILAGIETNVAIIEATVGGK